ncbi:MAG: ComF family protein [Kiritimatiellae bacterium]|nr:ComF family protein [Kiritimatiellia bacterium]
MRKCRRMLAFIQKLVDAVYPRICPICGKPADRPDRHICWDCFSSVDLYRDSLCDICGHFAESHVQHRFVCSTCQHVKPAFDRARAAGRYEQGLRTLIHSFKYRHALYLKRDLVDLLDGCLSAHFDPEQVDFVIPVPLHSLRFRERSYNQSAVLAQELSLRIDRRYDPDVLERIRQTETQTHFHAAERRKNMMGAFAVARPAWVRHRTVLVVDDVMTTGATLHACAQALKQAGADTVWGVALARGV